MLAFYLISFLFSLGCVCSNPTDETLFVSSERCGDTSNQFKPCSESLLEALEYTFSHQENISLVLLDRSIELSVSFVSNYLNHNINRTLLFSNNALSSDFRRILIKGGIPEIPTRVSFYELVPELHLGEAEVTFSNVELIFLGKITPQSNKALWCFFCLLRTNKETFLFLESVSVYMTPISKFTTDLQTYKFIFSESLYFSIRILNFYFEAKGPKILDYFFLNIFELKGF